MSCTPARCFVTVLFAILCSTSWVAPTAAQDPITGVRYPNFHLGVFGNVDFIAIPPESGRTGFRNGALDLFATSQVSERFSGLVELVFETLDGSLVTDLERYQISFDHSDMLRLTAGRVHNPLVRWNVTQHHGTFLQTPIDKPGMTEWEDVPGLWPVHFVGVIASGRFNNALGLSYTAGVGNGRGSILDEIQTADDRNDHKALLGGVGISPPSVVGLDLSVTAYLDRIPAESGEIDETDFTISGSYVARGYELRSEWSRMSHETAAQTFKTTGWYVLLSRHLPGSLENVRPYVMIDRLDVDESFEFLEGAVDQSNWIIGARYDVDASIALKADYRSQKFGTTEREGLLRFQLSFSLN
jgi:hypothetical protein